MNARSLTVILAAGKGTRMRSGRPKVMHTVGGLPMIAHVLGAVRGAGIGTTALVVAPDADWADAFADEALIFVQREQLGTAHAALCAREAFDGQDAVAVLFGDSPFIAAETIDRMLRRVHGGADIAVLAFEAADPTGYGRVLLDERGHVAAIREERDAGHKERAVRLCNSGIMAVRAGEPLKALTAIGTDNAKGEYYLTDLVAIGASRGFDVVLETAPQEEVLGINDRAQLAEAEAVFQRRARRKAMTSATLEAPETVFLSHDTVIGEDVTIEPHVVIAPGVSIGDGARIRAFSHLEGVLVEAGAVVGPYARLRPGTTIGPEARIGNFVEVKNGAVAAGAKVNHLTYIGDASVGAGANVGAGTVTCNYDGANKHHTRIGEGAFIGSNSALVAPVTIGERAYVGSGSVITDDVPADALAIARARQVTKPERSPAASRPAERAAVAEPSGEERSADGGEGEAS